jgi:sulfate adenylyltransferase
VQGGYPLDMRYAGPREGLLHAAFRQNYGCSKMIIGRDHAGVGDFYGMFEAQTIFDKIPTPEGGKALLCQPLKIDWTFYCYKCDGMASLRTCPHAKEDRVLLSGTMLRKMLSPKAASCPITSAATKSSPSCATTTKGSPKRSKSRPTRQLPATKPIGG